MTLQITINNLIMAMTNYKILNSRGKEIHTDVSLHPGEILQDELEARDIRKSLFAEQLGVKPGHLSELLHGRRHISAATALKLEKLLGISAEYWLLVQIHYDLFMERNKEQQVA
jgi:antitoxin HigA-1